MIQITAAGPLPLDWCPAMFDAIKRFLRDDRVVMFDSPRLAKGMILVLSVWLAVSLFA